MIELHTSNSIAVLTFRHGRVNAMDLEFLTNLSAELESLAGQTEIAAVILTSSGSSFSAGVDLKRLAREPLEYLDRFLPAIRRVFRQAFEFPKPLVGAIQGHALAGGCVLACGCDYRIANQESKIGMPELRVGLPLPPEGIEILRFVASSQHLQRIVTSGRTYIGPAAVEAGLVDESLPPDQVLTRARTIAQELARIPASVFGLSKRQIRQPILERICRHESRFMSEIDRLWRTDAVRANVSAYVAERL